MIFLTDWGLSVPTPYTAPECRAYALCGTAQNHPNPKFAPENGQVRTSVIKHHDGRVFETRSGSCYVLVGPPSPEFLKVLQDRGYDPDKLDPDNPMALFVGG